MNRPFTVVAVALAALGTLLSGVVSGRLNLRWGTSNAMQAAVESLESFPTEIGDWVLEDRFELEPRAVEMLECEAYVNGPFVNRKTGERVLVSLIVGPYGPMSVHTPEVCYTLAGYDMNAKVKKLVIGRAEDETAQEFKSAVFEVKDSGALPKHVYFAWFHKGRWMAPDWPRFGLGGNPALHKIQVATDYDDVGKEDEEHPCREFLEAFLPVWQEALGDS